MHLSVHLSQVGVLLKRPNVGSHKQCHTIAQGLFSDAEDLRKIQMEYPNGGPKYRWGRLNADAVAANW